MARALRIAFVGLLALSTLPFLGVAQADVTCETDCTNAQNGDNEASNGQSGTSASGDAVGGMVVGVVSSGDSSVDATNRSEDVDVSSGDTTASNGGAASFTGQAAPESGAVTISDVNVSGEAANAQDGDNSSDTMQAADATSGDGVAGSVIGVVTSAGGSADVVAANTSEDVNIDTGDADADNDLATFVGQFADGDLTVAADVIVGAEDEALNAQDGDNDLSADQSATAASGDGVGGQVLGIVSAGDSSVDATNFSEDVDIETGNTRGDNEIASVAGQVATEGGTTTVNASDVIADDAENAQDGDNSAELKQAAEATSGDGVGGQVIGAVTSAGGSADVVVANTSEDVDVETGDANADNLGASLVGQQADGDLVLTTDVTVGESDNAQDGDNDLSTDQTATASSGDGVGGQVLGIVSAGDASVDATNESTDVDLSTGDGAAANDYAVFVGQNIAEEEESGSTVIGTDVTAEESVNVQDGDNSKELSQNAVASTGDAVGGQVAGVVTSAGGSADLVLANTSEDVDGDTGDSEFNNTDEEFVGQNSGDLVIGAVEN